MGILLAILVLMLGSANQLKTERNIKLTGAIQGEAKFNGSKNIVIETSNVKSLVNYLYYQIYTNNQLLVKQVLGTSRNLIDTYKLSSNVEGMIRNGAFYCMQIDSLFMNNVRYLASILPSTNTYKTKLINWINNVTYIKYNSYDEEADLTIAQQFIVLANNTSGEVPTLQIINNNNSLPYLLLQIKNSIEE